MNNYNKKDLIEGLSKTNGACTQTSAIFSNTASELENMIIDHVRSLGINEIDGCDIYPTFRHDGQIAAIRCSLLFRVANSNDSNASIRNKQSVATHGNRNTDGRKTVLDFLPNVTNNDGNANNVITTNNFKTVIGNFCDGDIRVNYLSCSGKNGNRYIDYSTAVVEINFFKAMALLLAITSDSPYDFTIVNCIDTNNDDRYIIKYEKYIAIGKNNKRGRRYDNIDRAALYR